MSNEFKGLKSHSADWFGDSREHWWNLDFLEFLSKKWRMENVGTVLDVGCGVGHWGRQLERVLPATVRLIGVDRDPLWIQKATERAASAGLATRFQYRTAAAEQLPFNDDTFDLVTCQTLLMHLRDPADGLREMVRVAKPGGLILAAEATNLAGPALLDGIAMGETPEFIASLLRFQLHCQRGKAAVGEGDDLIGEWLPALFASAGLCDIEIRMNDRVNPMIPPYTSVAARAFVSDGEDSAEDDIWMWHHDEALRYFLAGGGRSEDFEALWTSATGFQRRVSEAIGAGRYIGAWGNLFYLIWGWKRAPACLTDTLEAKQPRGPSIQG